MWIDIADQSGQEYGKKIETTDEASNECGSISLIRSITIVDRTRIEMDGRFGRSRMSIDVTDQVFQGCGSNVETR